MRIAVFISSIREVFRSFTEEEFLEKLEKVYRSKETLEAFETQGSLRQRLQH